MNEIGELSAKIIRTRNEGGDTTLLVAQLQQLIMRVIRDEKISVLLNLYNN